MWHLDNIGTEFANDAQALQALKLYATRLLEERKELQAMGAQTIRLRDASGATLFEGAPEEAAKLNIEVQVRAVRQPEEG